MKAAKAGLIAAVVAVAACSGPSGPTGPAGPRGAAGVDGKNGEDGAEGAVGVDGEDGIPGTDGVDGVDGVDGDDGANALVELVDVEPGDDCIFGGQVFRSGTDEDRDGVLDDDEVDAATFFCSDTPPPPEDFFVGTNDDAQLLAGRTSISGSLFVSGDVTDLSPLADLTQVDGSVFINFTSLANLHGLENLSFVGGSVSLSDNTLLGDVSALGNLGFVGDLVIANCGALTTLSGLENVSPAFGIALGNNALLEDISALDDAAPSSAQFFDLPQVTALPALQGTSTISVDRLTSLASVAGPFTSTSMENVFLSALPIEDFTGMETVETIGDPDFLFGTLELRDLANASSFSGLDSVTFINQLNIINSPGLTGPVLDDFLSRVVVNFVFVESGGGGGGPAPPDAAEPNDVPEDAKDFVEGIAGGYTLPENDVDWFKLSYDTYSHVRFAEDFELSGCFDIGGGTELPEGCPEGVTSIAPVKVTLFKKEASGPPTEVAVLLPSVQPTLKSALSDFFANCGPLVEMVPVDGGVEYLLKVELNQELAGQVGVFQGHYALRDNVNSGGPGRISGFVTTPLTPLSHAGPAPVTPGTTVAEHEFLVGLSRMPQQFVKMILARHHLELIRMATPTIALVKPEGAGPSRVKTLEPADAKKLNEELRSLRRLSGLRFVEPNRVRFSRAVVPNDALYGEQWHYRQIGLETAWETTVGDDATVSAIIDSGLVTDHPDLQCGRIIAGHDFIDNDDDPADDAFIFSHGTHVLGTVGACTNDDADGDPRSGVAGVTHAGKLQMVRVCDGNGACFEDGIVSGIEWASGGTVEGVTDNPNPAKVLNMSLGGPGRSAAFAEAINNATARGSIVVVAAGNDTADAANFSPAGEDNVITVGAVGPSGEIASYSNFGKTIEVMAPGGEGSGIPGEQNNDRDGVLSTSGGTSTGPSFLWLSGTSMASPHIAGVVALMHAVRPGLTLAQATAILAETADPIAGCEADVCGPGLVDAAAAVEMAAGSLPAILKASAVVRARDASTVDFTLTNVGETSATLAVTNGSRVSAVTADPVVVGGASTVVTVTVNRAGLSPGRYTQELAITGGVRALKLLVEFDVRDNLGRLPQPPAARAFLIVHEDLEQGDGIQTREVALGSEMASTQKFTEDEGFVFDKIVQGDYFVYVEADLDQDGVPDAVSCGAPIDNPEECPRISVDLFGDVELDGEPLTDPLELVLAPAERIAPPEVAPGPRETLPN